MTETAIIVGGGLAGLAAAVALAKRGVSVTLLESRPRLGGRASSFVDRETEMQIDNCQHVSMGCCTNFQHFCETVGIAEMFQTEKQLNFIGPNVTEQNGPIDRLSASFLPAPLHLMPAFRKLSYLSQHEKRQLANGLKTLARADVTKHSEQTFDQWLIEHNQPTAVVERFWKVVLVSALSESLDRISIPHARKVFVDAFLANRHGWEVSIPKVSLDSLYGSELTDWLEKRGVEIQLQAGVKRLQAENEIISGIELRTGNRLKADHYIVAVPHHLVLSLLPTPLQAHPQLAEIAKLESAPIASVHLWFDREITSLPHAVLIERLSQWMFNRSALQEETSNCEKNKAANSKNEQHSPSPPLSLSSSFLAYYQIVISAARNLSGMSQDEVIAEVVRELTEIWPTTAMAELVHSRMVTEHRAVFSVKPGADELRPSQQSPINNLQLAGDWTQTGWPGTMEGAVRSGYLAAENILGHVGRPQKLLQPDLPVSLLSKILFRL